MRIHEMNNEQYAAHTLNNSLISIATRLEREAQEIRDHAYRVQHGQTTSYTADMASVQNSLLWTIANCNLGVLTSYAADAEKGRAQDKAEADRAGEEAALASLTATDEELDAQHGSMA